MPTKNLPKGMEHQKGMDWKKNVSWRCQKLLRMWYTLELSHYIKPKLMILWIWCKNDVLFPKGDMFMFHTVDGRNPKQPPRMYKNL